MSLIINGTEVTEVKVNGVSVTEVRVVTSGSSDYVVVFSTGSSDIPMASSYSLFDIADFYGSSWQNESQVDYGLILYDKVAQIQERLFNGKRNIVYLFDSLNAHYNFNYSAFADTYSAFAETFDVTDIYKNNNCDTPIGFLDSMGVRYPPSTIYTTFDIIDSQKAADSEGDYSSYIPCFGGALKYGVTISPSLFNVPYSEKDYFYNITEDSTVFSNGNNIVLIWIDENMTDARLGFILIKIAHEETGFVSTITSGANQKLMILLAGNETIESFNHYAGIILNHVPYLTNRPVDFNILRNYNAWKNELGTILTETPTNDCFYMFPVPLTKLFIKSQGWDWSDYLGRKNAYIANALNTLWATDSSGQTQYFHDFLIRFDDLEIDKSQNHHVLEAMASRGGTPKFYIPNYIYNMVNMLDSNKFKALVRPFALYTDQINLGVEGNMAATNCTAIANTFDHVYLGYRLSFLLNHNVEADENDISWSPLFKKIIATEKQRSNADSLTNAEFLFAMNMALNEITINCIDERTWTIDIREIVIGSQ